MAPLVLVLSFPAAAWVRTRASHPWVHFGWVRDVGGAGAYTAGPHICIAPGLCARRSAGRPSIACGPVGAGRAVPRAPEGAGPAITRARRRAGHAARARARAREGTRHPARGTGHGARGTRHGARGTRDAGRGPPDAERPSRFGRFVAVGFGLVLTRTCHSPTMSATPAHGVLSAHSADSPGTSHRSTPRSTPHTSGDPGISGETRRIMRLRIKGGGHPPHPPHPADAAGAPPPSPPCSPSLSRPPSRPRPARHGDLRGAPPPRTGRRSASTRSISTSAPRQVPYGDLPDGRVDRRGRRGDRRRLGPRGPGQEAARSSATRSRRSAPPPTGPSAADVRHPRLPLGRLAVPQLRRDERGDQPAHRRSTRAS